MPKNAESLVAMGIPVFSWTMEGQEFHMTTIFISHNNPSMCKNFDL